MKTRFDVEVLKMDWISDPCWDIYDTDGFEEYRDELKKFQESHEAIWESQREWAQLEAKTTAEKLGLHGLHEKLLWIETLQERHGRAIELLTNGMTQEAYRVLRRFDE